MVGRKNKNYFILVKNFLEVFLIIGAK